MDWNREASVFVSKSIYEMSSFGLCAPECHCQCERAQLCVGEAPDEATGATLSLQSMAKSARAQY